MGIDFTLLSNAIKNKEGNHIYISEDKYGWYIELWNKPADELVGTYCISQSICIKTILDFIPANNLSYVTNIPAVQSILEEMKLCQ